MRARRSLRGDRHVDFPDGRRLVPVLVVTWSYSNAPFAVALPTERVEAVLHGMSEAFAFRGRRPAGDDSTFILLHHTAAPAGSPGLLESLMVCAKVLGLKSV